MTLGGLPHSEIPGSTPICGSPRLFAACHVLHRLSVPRHPPYALTSLKYLSRALSHDIHTEPGPPAFTGAQILFCR